MKEKFYWSLAVAWLAGLVALCGIVVFGLLAGGRREIGDLRFDPDGRLRWTDGGVELSHDTLHRCRPVGFVDVGPRIHAIKILLEAYGVLDPDAPAVDVCDDAEFVAIVVRGPAIAMRRPEGIWMTPTAGGFTDAVRKLQAGGPVDSEDPLLWLSGAIARILRDGPAAQVLRERLEAVGGGEAAMLAALLQRWPEH